MPYLFTRCFLILFAISLAMGCSSYQPTKNVWKTTKGLWHEYVSPPARVDYEDKGELQPQARALASAMLSVDVELARLERVMQNADKPPTQEWLNKFLADFPWLSGFAGVKYNGEILGQQPAESLKELDFIPLLYEDKKQNSRALRADVQPSPLGPEVMLATPLYDGVDFLGIVVAYFDMRALMKYSSDADNIVVLCPTALLWPGKYDFAATPLAGIDWKKVVAESAAGSCSNVNGSFFYMVRYFGNLPLVFAIPEKGDFPAGNGGMEQGLAFFPQEREKLPPPPMPERKPGEGNAVASFGRPSEEAGMEAVPEENMEPERAPQRAESQKAPNEIQPGSRESVLLKGGRGRKGRHIQERQLEGENIRVERVQRARQPEKQRPEPKLELIPDSDMPTLSGGRPSPFGPREGQQREFKRPSPFGPGKSAEQAPSQAEPDASDSPQASPDADKPSAATDQAESGTRAAEAPAENDASPEPDSAANVPDAQETERQRHGNRPALLPGGRPSPFGPRNN